VAKSPHGTEGHAQQLTDMNKGLRSGTTKFFFQRQDIAGTTALIGVSGI
jgi:hypothetical protein